MAVRDYYDILGVPTTASPRDIRETFRRLARQCSPDIVIGDQRATSIFIEIEEAYQVLSDPMRRALYDHESRARTTSSRTAATGAARGLPLPRGDDLRRTVELTFEEAVRGSSIRLPIIRKAHCDSCGGSGARSGGLGPCPACDGRGHDRSSRDDAGFGEACPRCHGTGEAARDPCPRCLGLGLVTRQEEVEVGILPGADTGSQFRIHGKGNDGPRGGPAGDLLVVTRVRPHPFFNRKGDNLYCELPITVPEAILGARISVPTPDGTTVMTVPAGTQSGQVFRLRGKGCARLAGTGRGDLYVATRVVIPPAVDPAWGETVSRLGGLYLEHPRAGLETPALGRKGRHGG